MKRGWLCEWKLDRAGNPSKVTTEECLECAAGWDNACQWPHPLLKWVLADREARPEDAISLTVLINRCPREFFFRLTEDWWENIKGRSAAVDGILWHQAAQQAASDGLIVEKTFGWPLTDDFTLTFRPDLVLPDAGLVVDYKRTRTAPKNLVPWSNHALQISAELLMLNSTRLLVPKGDRWAGDFEPHKAFSLEAAEVDYYVPATGQRVRCRIYDEPGRGQHPIQRESLSILGDRLPLFLSARKGEPPPYRDCVGTSQNPGPWRWKCKGYCDFPDECRRRVQQEEKKRGKGFTDGVKEGRASVAQQLSTKEGAEGFVEELSAQQKGYLSAALK